MTELPPVVTYGTVTGDLLKAIGDTEDPDTRPDRAGVPGAKITFTPSVPRVLFASPVKKVIMPAPIEVPLPHEASSFTGQFSVDLVATDNDAGNPVDWTYTVKVEVPDVETWEFPISVATDSVEDLADLIPVAVSEGTLTIRGPKGDPGPQGDPGPPGTLFDTGWRDLTGEIAGAMLWGRMGVRRVGPFVYFTNGDEDGEGAVWANPTPGSPSTVWTAPVGFRPSAPAPLSPAVDGMGSLVGAVHILPTGAVDVWGDEWLPRGSYITDDPDPAPAELPGTPWTP